MKKVHRYTSKQVCTYMYIRWTLAIKRAYITRKQVYNKVTILQTKYTGAHLIIGSKINI